ncbi:MAG TPA: CopG family transcriptional regulator [Euzebya sp.]|nr:CopG family transcriptional regulator [Euzebya sp.]
MRRTTVMLPDDVDARLRYEARRRGVSLADLAREAIVAYLPGPSDDRALSFFDLGETEQTDLSERVEEALPDVIARGAVRDQGDPA